MTTKNGMNAGDIAACMAEGTICFMDKDQCTGDCSWNAHPAFAGVALKHLIRGVDTGGALSCHMVRIDPGCCLENHAHEGQWELHEVVRGQGKARLAGREVDYLPGGMAVIPMGQPHRVEAGPDGMVLLAKFFPALV